MIVLLGNELNGDDGDIVEDIILLMQAGLTDVERNCKQINKKNHGNFHKLLDSNLIFFIL